MPGVKLLTWSSDACATPAESKGRARMSASPSPGVCPDHEKPAARVHGDVGFAGIACGEVDLELATCLLTGGGEALRHDLGGAIIAVPDDDEAAGRVAPHVRIDLRLRREGVDAEVDTETDTGGGESCREHFVVAASVTGCISPDHDEAAVAPAADVGVALEARGDRVDQELAGHGNRVLSGSRAERRCEQDRDRERC